MKVLAGAQVIGPQGIQKLTEVWTLQDPIPAHECRRRPERLWIDTWRD
jgi:hypothetical protein